MSPAPRHPQTHEPLGSYHEFHDAAQALADATPLPADLPAVVPAEQPLTSLQMRVEAFIQEKVRPAAAAERAAGEAEMAAPEDPWGSMGGGHNTYHQTGMLPVPGEIRQMSARGRGGKLVTRVFHEGTGRFIDVPVDERAHSRSLEDARERLQAGEGAPIARLKRKQSRQV